MGLLVREEFFPVREEFQILVEIFTPGSLGGPMHAVTSFNRTVEP